MNKVEIARRLRDLESEIGCLREDLEHDLSWDTAKAQIDRPIEVETDPEEWLDFARPRTFRDLDPEAAFVEQIEMFIHDQDKTYHVRLRFDDDSTEKMGIFSQYASAYDYAKTQARRYHVPIFDSTYEDLVD